MRYHCATTLRLFAPDIMPYVNGVVPPIWRQLTKLYTFARSASSVRPNRKGRAAGHGAKPLLTRSDWALFEPAARVRGRLLENDREHRLEGARRTGAGQAVFPAHRALAVRRRRAFDLTALKREPARTTGTKRATMDV